MASPAAAAVAAVVPVGDTDGDFDSDLVGGAPPFRDDDVELDDDDDVTAGLCASPVLTEVVVATPEKKSPRVICILW